MIRTYVSKNTCIIRVRFVQQSMLLCYLLAVSTTCGNCSQSHNAVILQRIKGLFPLDNYTFRSATWN